MEYQTWLAGVYVQYAVASSLSSKCKYPDKPFNFTKKASEQQKNIESSGKTKEEIEQEQRYYELLIRQANAKLASARKDNEGKDG